MILILNDKIDVYRGTWGGKHCRDSPIQSLRDCSCREGECEAGDNYVDQVKDVLNHSVPKGGKIAAFFAGMFLFNLLAGLT
jgi:alanine-glyoxylate transaminase/(R)-3-amino-2-methylpropionate-pyruvate transaminase